MLKRISILTGFCLASLAALPGAALAQQTNTAPAPAATNSDEIIVTAQKRAESLKEVPLAIQAISGEQLDAAGIRQIGDLVKQIPGASIVASITPGRDTVQIRGIAAGTTGDGLVGYYIDETPFGIPNLQLSPPSSLIDVERVEVIRGPSGTLYGSGSMGGNIKIVTKKPDSTALSGLIKGDYSNTSGGDDNYSVNGVLNVPIVHDRLAVRLNVGHEVLGGYADDPQTAKSNVNSFLGLSQRVSALWTPTNDLDVTAQVWRIRDKQNYSNALTAASTLKSLNPLDVGNPIITGTNFRSDFQNTDMDLYSLTANWNLGFATLTANGSNIIHKLELNDATSNIVNNFSQFKTVSATEEVRLTSNGDGPFKWLVGGFHRDAIIKSYIDVGILPNAPRVLKPETPLIYTYGIIHTDAYAAFAEASYEMFDGKLTPTIGVRYSNDDRDGYGRDLATNTVSPRAASWDSVNPRFNLKYRPNEEVMFYFNAAKGFRSGSFQTQGQVNASAGLGIPTKTGVDPDSVWTYEVGTRIDPIDTLEVEASLYHSEFKDIIIQFTSPAVVSLANGGDADIDGLDIGLRWHTPLTGLNLSFEGSLLNTNFTKVVPALSIALPTIAVGKPLPNVPTSNFTVAGDYSRRTGWNDVALKMYAGYTFRGSQIDAASGRVSGELNDLTLRAGFDAAHWNFNVFALNALDDDDPAVLGSSTLTILYPRRVGVELGYKF